MSEETPGAPAGSVTGMVVAPCADLDRAIEDHVARGFVLRAIGPADEPTWAELSVPGIRLLLDASSGRDGPLRLRVGPAGTESAVVVPPVVQALEIEHELDGSWQGGRAGMRYRDLVPGRHGGAVIASHIHVPDGGPVPDYVHHHDVVVQLIVCHRGWVRVVYEDQGPSFVLAPGDCVIQPPGIRHRVLEASDDLYVVELTSPADHRTNVDHGRPLPTPQLRPARRFGGQRFHRHVAAEARWRPVGDGGLELADLGLAGPTAGAADGRRLRVGAGHRGAGAEATVEVAHDAAFRLVFVLAGSVALSVQGSDEAPLGEGSSASIPAGRAASVTLRAGAELLDITFHLEVVRPSGRGERLG